MVRWAGRRRWGAAPGRRGEDGTAAIPVVEALIPCGHASILPRRTSPW